MNIKLFCGQGEGPRVQRLRASLIAAYATTGSITARK